MRFSPEFLDRLRQQVTLSQVVGRRVALRRHGREHQGLCPFHKEKTPSFTVSDEKGFYHCFGCGAHGDAIRFLTDYEGVPYPEAVERLAAEFGLPLPQMTREQVETARKLGSLQEVMEAACLWFEAQLKAPAGKAAQDYLKNRGLTGQTAKRFRLGFAPPGRDLLKQHLMKQGVTETQLIETGLAIKPDSGASYDRFRARVIFPITDRRGKVIAFGGRILPALAEALPPNAPKYLNSPETSLFRKGEVLYAHEQARQGAHKAGTVLVTEGYMDVIALHQLGFTHAVAPLGTAVTEQHLRLLWQMVDEPVLCLDGDAAGQRAMHRAAELSLPLLKPGKSLHFLVLPKGEDPDTLVRKEGAEAFAARLGSQSVALSDALWEHYAGEGQVAASPEKRAALEHTLNGLAERIADPVVKAHFRAFFRSKLWPERNVAKKQGEGTLLRTRSTERYAKSGDNRFATQEQMLLRLVLNHPALLEHGEVEDALSGLIFNDPALERLRLLVLDTLLHDPALSRETIERQTREARLWTEAEALYRAGGEADITRALLRWRLELSAHAVLRVQAECRVLETEIADTMEEAVFARLLALKAQIATLEKESAALKEALMS